MAATALTLTDRPGLLTALIPVGTSPLGASQLPARNDAGTSRPHRSVDLATHGFAGVARTRN